VHIHDKGLVALQRLPLYAHTASDVDKVLRYMRRQGIAPLDVDISDNLKGLLDPKKADRLRLPVGKIRKRRLTVKEMAKLWNLPLEFVKELDKEWRLSLSH